MSVHALKLASRTSSQVHFFIGYLRIEIEQLILIDVYEKRQTKECQGERITRRTTQTNTNTAGDRTYRTCFQNFNGIDNRDRQPQKQRQDAQQGRMVGVQKFPCPLGCWHLLPWGSMTGCENFIKMNPQIRKDTADKLKVSKCCLKNKGRPREPDNCRTALCQCGRNPPHNELLCPAQHAQMTNLENNYELVENFSKKDTPKRDTISW